MLESAEHLDLSEDTLGRDNSLEDVWHFLQRHAPTGPRVSHGPDNAEGAVADHLVRLLGIDLRRCLAACLLLLWSALAHRLTATVELAHTRLHHLLLLLLLLAVGELAVGRQGGCGGEVSSVVLHGVERGELACLAGVSVEVAVACVVIAAGEHGRVGANVGVGEHGSDVVGGGVAGGGTR